MIEKLACSLGSLAWGSMTALTMIADIRPVEIFKHIHNIRKAYETGSVITIDNSMTVFAKLCKASELPST